MAAAVSAGSASLRTPSSSTGAPSTRRPTDSGIDQPVGWEGVSKAIAVAPRASSTRETMARPWVKPWVIAIRSGSMRTPRTRPR
jgi:hypothetical protein